MLFPDLDLLVFVTTYVYDVSFPFFLGTIWYPLDLPPNIESNAATSISQISSLLPSLSSSSSETINMSKYLP